MWFEFEEGRTHNVFQDKPAKWPTGKKENPSKYTPTTNSYDFARRPDH